MRVSLSNSDLSFSAAADRPLLDAALAAGLHLPYGCKGGNCGACRARVLQGAVIYPNGRPLGLSDAEVEDGFILLCQARPVGDLRIETFELATPETAVVKRLPCRIDRTLRLSYDVLTVFLRLPAAESFAFQAGQYIDIMLTGGRRRSFSIASPPHDSGLLELHVRYVVGGEFTERLFGGTQAGALLQIEGPLGQFLYRPAPSGVPLLMVGGGTGLAPLKSIMRHVIENGLKRPLILFWGVRSERDLYADEELTALARSTPEFSYRPVLSEPGPDWRGLTGWVHEAVMREGPPLAALDIYASGPPAMIAAVRQHFPGHGADAARLYFDSFDYAPDTLERQRMMAANIS